MFEHLDDVAPFVPDAALRATVAREGTRRRRRRRGARGAAYVTVPLVVLAGTLAAAAGWRTSGVHRVSLGDIAQIGADGRPATLNTGDLGRPFTILVAGSDRRPGDDSERTDVLMVVRVDPPAGRLRIVSLPRDLWISPADGSGAAKINSLLGRSRQALVGTVNQMVATGIDHYAETDMDGFARVVDAGGGVPVVVDAPLRDERSGLYAQAGCQVVDGDTALALVRSRYLQVRDPSGRWTNDTGYDLGRVARQQVLVQAALARTDRSLDPVALARLATTDLTLDEHLDADGLAGLARWAATLGPDAVETLTPEVSVATIADQSVLQLAPGARERMQAFLAGEPAPAAAPPASGTTTDPGAVLPPADAHIRPAPGGHC